MSNEKESKPIKPATTEKAEPARELNDEELKAVAGGLNPQPLPPISNRHNM